MLYKYHCACCDEPVLSSQRECPKCGSHHIKSPIQLWVFCIAACLAAVLVFKLVHIYTQDRNAQDTPTQQSLLDVLNEDQRSTGHQ